jgi:hypothetical protein
MCEFLITLHIVSLSVVLTFTPGIGCTTICCALRTQSYCTHYRLIWFSCPLIWDKCHLTRVKMPERHLLCPHLCAFIFLLLFHVSTLRSSRGMPQPVLILASVVVQLVTSVDGEFDGGIWCRYVSRCKSFVYIFKKVRKKMRKIPAIYMDISDFVRKPRRVVDIVYTRTTFFYCHIWCSFAK